MIQSIRTKRRLIICEHYLERKQILHAMANDGQSEHDSLKTGFSENHADSSPLYQMGKITAAFCSLNKLVRIKCCNKTYRLWCCTSTLLWKPVYYLKFEFCFSTGSDFYETNLEGSGFPVFFIADSTVMPVFLVSTLDSKCSLEN